MHKLLSSMIVILSIVPTAFSKTINVSPNSSGAITCSIETNSYHSGVMDTLVFSNGASIFVKKMGAYFTDGGSCREVYYLSPDTSTVELFYKKDEIIKTEYGNLTEGMIYYKYESSFFSTTLSGDTCWYDSKLFPSQIKEDFDSLTDELNHNEGVIECGKPLIHYYLYNSIGMMYPTDSMYRIPGYNTIFYGKSKNDNLMFKFQVYFIDDLKGSASESSCDLKLLWSVDSLGNGVFKADSLVELSHENWMKMNHVGYKINNNTLSFNRPIEAHSKIQIFNLSGREIYTVNKENAIYSIDLPLPNGFYLCRIVSRNGILNFRFVMH